MSILAIILVIVLGLFLMVIEFLLVPGITVAGIAGAILIAGGIIITYTTHGTPDGHYMLMGTFGAVVLTIYLSVRASTWEKFMLSDNITGVSNDDLTEQQVKPGDTGKAITRLNPAGNVRVNGLIIEGRSNGDFINEGTEVVVTKINHSRIIVKPKI
mgnify:CR=1 FL=1